MSSMAPSPKFLLHCGTVARNPLLLLRSNTPRVTHASQPPSRRRSHTTSAERAPTPAPAFARKPLCRAPGDRKPRPTPMSTLFQAETKGRLDLRNQQRAMSTSNQTKGRRKSKRRQTGSTAPAASRNVRAPRPLFLPLNPSSLSRSRGTVEKVGVVHMQACAVPPWAVIEVQSLYAKCRGSA
jgi:hypothetical protein